MANIAIVGGGVAGLSAGIYAQMNGHNATIYERHFKAGGNLTGWDRNGYHIDNCIHWLTGTNPLNEFYKMWEDLGALGNVEVYQADTLYTFEKDGQSISLSNRIDKVKADMLRISPEDKGEILSFIRAVKALQYLNGFSGKDCDQKSTFMQKILSAPSLMKYSKLTTGDLAKRFKHPLLRGFIESFMTDYFSSLALIMVFATFCGENGGIPKGSSCAMAERMVERFLSLGGKLLLRKGVSEINVRGEEALSVTLEDGTVEKADYVILATDPAATFGKLLDKKLMPKALRKQYDDPRMIRFSSYHCAFSCDSAELPFHSDLVVEVPEKYRDELNTSYMMIREFSHEKSFSPEGKSLIQTMIYCVEDDACEFIELSRDKVAYKEKKSKIAEDIKDIITDKLPALREKLQCVDVWTPATYRRYVNSEMGSFMSFALPSGSMPKKISNSIKGLKNVVLATQWLQAPGGLPIAAMSGVDAIKTILKKEKRKKRKTVVATR